MGWFSWGASKAKPGRLARQLKTYPPYRAPFRGPCRLLSNEQAKANLQYLLDHRAERIQALGEVLGEAGIDLRAGMQAQDIEPLLTALRRWMVAEWPGVYRPAIAKREVWEATDRSGDQIVYSLLMDLAILFGELVIARRPRFVWQADLERIPGHDQMTHYRQIVVMIPQGGAFPAQIVMDVEAEVVSQYLRVRSPLFGRLNDLTRGVSEAVSGGYEQYWLEEAARNGMS